MIYNDHIDERVARGPKWNSESIDVSANER